LDERKTKELKIMESTLSMELNMSRVALKDVEYQLQKRIEEEFAGVKSMIIEQKKACERNEEHQSKELTRKLTVLTDTIEQQRKMW
jgi:hypothetical protein